MKERRERDNLIYLKVALLTKYIMADSDIVLVFHINY